VTKQIKIRKRVRDRIYRISFLNREGKYKEPVNKFETYRTIKKDGKDKREWECFPTIEEAEKFRGSTKVVDTAKGITLREAVESWKKIYFPNIQPSTKENVLKVFPDAEEREAKKRSGKERELPCDYLLDYEMKELGGIKGPEIIDEWLAHIKDPEFLAKQKKTRLSYFHEYEVMKVYFGYFESTGEGREMGFRSPLLKRHRKNVVFKHRPPAQAKDMKYDVFLKFLAAMRESTSCTDYENVMPMMAEFQYISYSRLSEAAAVHIEDVDAVANKITLSKSIQYLKRGEQRAVLRDGHKANGGRIIYSPEGVKLLLEVALKRGIRSGPLFFVDGKPIPYKAIQNHYDRAHKIAKTGQSGTHVLRHASLTEFYEQTKDLRQTMTVASHADVKSTIRYTKARDEAVRLSQEQMDQRLRTIRVVG
jgi:integrase